MKILASDFYTYYKPSVCPLRVYLLEMGEKPSPPGPLEYLLVSLGERHEMAHRATFPDIVDLGELSFPERLQRTLEEVDRATPVIYQGAFSAEVSGVWGKISLTGQPDFLIYQDGGYIIRDCKLARRINEDDHPDIIAQLDLYRYLFQKAMGDHPKGVEVFSGSEEVLEIRSKGEDTVLSRIDELAQIKSLRAEPYTPVGWSKCSGCGFFNRCWPLAEKRRDVATVPDVTLNLSAELREIGIFSYEDLLSRFSAEELSSLKVPYGKGLRKVGVRAERILVNTRAISQGAEIVTGRAGIPGSGGYAMFDLEGLPPYLDELDKIYLWGVKVMGEEPSEYMPALAGFGPRGDGEGWEEFLRVCSKIFSRYGDVPFVHWSSYERTKVRGYLDRYGDRGGVAQRVLNNLFDLLPAVKGSIALPIPSYSLKVVEKHIGFHRTMDEYGGEWAIAKYIEAVETEDDDLREEIMTKILQYNEEDLDATWAVMEWFRNKLRISETE
jgi:uncharacterized protein